MPLRRTCRGALWGLLLWAAIAVGAPVSLDLPAQPLAESLKQLARTAGVTIAVDTALVAGKTAPPIKGTLEPDEALRRLLAGSDLEAVPSPGGGFVVRRTQPRGRSEDQRLPEVRVQAPAQRETASGPVEGYVARRSATGTKTDTPILETPQSVSVIARERIEDQGAQSLQEALRYSAGVQSEPLGFEPRLPFIHIRGFDVSDFATGAFAHRLLAGIDYQHADAEAAQGFASAQAFGGTTPPIDVFDPVYGSPTPLPARVDNGARQEQVGLYLQDQVEYGRWILGLNGRYDWAKTELQDRLFFTAGGDSRQEDEEFTGRVGLLYRFPSGLAPYASYSTSFLPAIGSDPGGRPFEPEKAKQYEAGIKFQPPGSRSFLSVAYFDLTRENFIQSNPLTFVQEQTGEVRSRGVELEGVANFPFGLDLIASYTWLDAEITRSNDPAEIGARPTQTPRQLASLWAQYRLFGGPVRGLGVGAGVRYIGANFGDTPNTVKVSSVTLVDAALFYDWGRVRLAVNAHNLFDKEYVAAAFGSFATYGLRRTVIGSLRYRW